jgi:hypothetical protein
MAKPLEKRKRRVETFQSVTPDKRTNPESLRRMLFDIVFYDFDRSCRDASEAFAALLQQAPERRYFRAKGKGRGISDEAIYTVTRDLHSLTYAQLDAMALHNKLPLGLILLYSRVRSDIAAQAGNTQEAIDIIAAAKTFLTELEKVILHKKGQKIDAYQLLDHANFVNLRNIYLEEIRRLSGTLFHI